DAARVGIRGVDAEDQVLLAARRAVVGEPPRGSRDARIVLPQRDAAGVGVGVQPRLDRELAVELEARAIRYRDVGIRAIEAERQVDPTPGEGHVTAQRAVVTADGVGRVAFAAPPA